MLASVGFFAAGCGTGALAIVSLNMFAFVIPPVVGLAAFVVPRGASDVLA
jgi:hypothetical protein